MLQGKGSVDSCCAVGAAAARKLVGTFAAIKSPADIPEAERPAGTMAVSGRRHSIRDRAADCDRMGANAPSHNHPFRRLILPLVVRRHIVVAIGEAGGL
jgi:hypothetical protein